MDEKNSSVTKPKSSQALYHMIFNALLPGLGSLVYTRFLLFIPVVILFGIAVFMLITMNDWAKLYAFIILIVWWLVSFLGSVYYYMKDPWSDKE
ncbi:MAG: hypothetical protein JXR91_13185 [Deltaproteobacteria bacterium]|nr:hypothetical protein [Deltaproteobacteria bacterium]